MPLQEDGHMTISQITKSYDLPSDLLQKEVYAALGGRIQGILDKDDKSFIYTTGYVSKQRSILRGALSGLTKLDFICSFCFSGRKVAPLVFNVLLGTPSRTSWFNQASRFGLVHSGVARFV